jgi:tetratricopeptide (TPR) repeat protein
MPTQQPAGDGRLVDDPRFRLRHRLTAAAVFLCALVLYTLTMAPTTSFWDCGEFIASSWSLSVPHPPGAPFYLLLGRLFSMLPIAADIGARVNFLSVLSSALTVMLLYLTVVHMIRYWQPRPGFAELAGAAIGALTFMATDTFWFNAVESEVYAISTLFTALVVWLGFVWHDLEVRSPHGGDRVVMLVFYLIGLAIGVHLLNVLALPMVFLLIYFHWQADKPFHLQRFLLFWGLAVLSILPVYPGIVLWLPKLLRAAEAVGDDIFADLVLLALLVGLGVFHLWAARRGRRLPALASAAVFLVVIGYLSYALILLRSGQNPPLDENDPETIEALIAYLSREQYGSESILTQLFQRKAPFWDYQIQHMYIRYFNWNFIGRDIASGQWSMQLWGLPLLVGLWGLVTHVGRDWRRAFTIGNLFLLTGLAIVIYLNQDDPQPRERDYAYVGSFYAFALWIGVGAATLLEDLGQLAHRARRVLQPAAALALLLLLPLQMVRANYFSHDRSGNYVAQDYARNSLNTLDEGAIIFTNGDNDTFPLWYLQIVESHRPDVRVVNLSLLNTGWYIRQLRDVEPQVPLPASFTDEMIAAAIDGQGQAAFSWRYWGPEVWHDRDGTPLPPERVHRVPLRDRDGGTTWIEVKPTMHVPLGDGNSRNNFLRVQDRMILEILKANNWQRPIYFAVTVAHNNFVGLDEHLRMDGLAYRVLDRPQPRSLDPEILRGRLRVYEPYFRGLDDPGVYFDDNIQKLVQNYRSAYIQLALELEERGRRTEALAELEAMDRHLPEAVVPAINPMLSLQLGLLFERLGEPEGMRRRLENLEARPNLDLETRFSIGSYWIEPLGDLERGLAILDDLAAIDGSGQVRLETAILLEQTGRLDPARERIREILLDQPEDSDALAAAIRIEEAAGDWRAALSLVESWLARHPEDDSAQRRADRYRERLAAQGDSLDG